MKLGNIPERDLNAADFVRERRRAAHLTQGELGALAGVGKRFLVELESGKPTLRMDKVNQVLAVFGRRLGPVALSSEAAEMPTTQSEPRSAGDGGGVR